MSWFHSGDKNWLSNRVLNIQVKIRFQGEGGFFDWIFYVNLTGYSNSTVKMMSKSCLGFIQAIKIRRVIEFQRFKNEQLRVDFKCCVSGGRGDFSIGFFM